MYGSGFTCILAFMAGLMFWVGLGVWDEMVGK